MISCYKTIYESYDTKIAIDSIRVSNAKLEKKYYKIFKGDSIQYGKYSIMVKFEIEDSLRNTGKNSAFIRNFSMFQDVYCSNNPGEVIGFKLKDSIQSIRINSLFDFDDSLKANADLKGCFDFGYHTYYVWKDTVDSITGIKKLDDLHKINRLFTDLDRHFDNLALFLTLNKKPKYEKQRFVISFKFQSTKIKSDTTKVVNIK
jgi:hypothetical protein